MRFADREDAGRRLGYNLGLHPYDEPIVVGLPRGGVPVAAEVAARLGAPLDVLVLRRLTYPRDPAIGLGVVAEGGMRLLDEDLISSLDMTAPQLEAVAAAEDAEVRRRARHYRDNRPQLPVDGRTVIVVDDGVATGLLARAAIEVQRRRHAGHVVLAVPVGPARTVHALRDHADDVVCLHAPHAFAAIRHWYDHFAAVDDDRVAELFAAHRATAGIA